jgi:uncharacterized protein YcbX
MIEQIARDCGLVLESWMTNPPKPAMWHATPEQLDAVARAYIAFGMELAAQIVENVTSEVWHDGNYAVAAAIRSKAVQNTVQVSGAVKETGHDF